MSRRTLADRCSRRRIALSDPLGGPVCCGVFAGSLSGCRRGPVGRFGRGRPGGRGKTLPFSGVAVGEYIRPADCYLPVNISGRGILNLGSGSF